MCSTYCHQESSDNFHAAGQERATTEVAALYEAIKNMPDGPQKALFLKKVRVKYPVFGLVICSPFFYNSLSVRVFLHLLPLLKSPGLGSKATRYRTHIQNTTFTALHTSGELHYTKSELKAL